MPVRALLLAALFCFSFCLSFAQVIIDTEGGIALQGYNNIQVPGESGTRFQAHRSFKTGATPFFRIKAGFRINNRHNLLILAAPLTLKASGIVPHNIRFQDVVFQSGEQVHFRYRFDSYRFTYRYDFIRSEELRFGIGASLKVRDAAIRMSSNNAFAEKAAIGIVPLITVYFNPVLYRDWGVLLEADALASPQGRAEDVQAAITYELADIIRLKAGYRIQEGGVNNADVYNFAMVHYLMTGLLLNF